VRSVALTKGQIADILFRRDELDEALRIRTEEQLPIFERLGYVREIAITKGQIANILFHRGELDEALRLRTEEQLPVLERLGDVRAIAIAKGRIAKIFTQKGDLVRARDLHLERLETNRRLNDGDGIAATLSDLAQCGLASRDVVEVAPKLAEAYSILEKIGRAEPLAAVGFSYGQMLAGVGKRDQAIAVLRTSAAASRKLGQSEQVAQMEQLIEQLT
jgi:tetratricopeptide (TPR) repeat protein